MNLDIQPGGLLSLITIVAGITIYSFIRSRHLERMQQLEMGDTLDNEHRNYFEIKFGLLFTGIGIGILVAFILNHSYMKDANELYPAFVFLFGGLGLLFSYLIVENLKRNN